MEKQRSLTMNGITGINFLYIMNAVAMIGVSIYLTTHFYQTLYPTTLGGAGSLCDISNFFNCDAATYSPLSNIAGIPISTFGALIGLLFLFSSIIPSASMEKTASAFSKYNFIGCLVLFTYSLASLGSLCPFCTLYYLLSGIACFLLWRFGLNSWVPEVKTTAGFGVVAAIAAFAMFQTTSAKDDTKSKINAQIVEQYQKLPHQGEPDQESPFKVHMATASFSESPIRITVFSDFECPYCKVVADQLPELVRRYPNKVSIQYMFYPLDNKCNPNIKSRFHQSACDAAYLAACDEKKFVPVHDEIFENQEKLRGGNSSVLLDIARRHGLSGCLENADVKNLVINTINQADKYNIKSTPTLIVNGKKISGTIPNSQFFAIFEHILKGQN
jgi:protein-disulfide isomerase